MEVAVGQVYRPKFGGKPVQVVAVEDRLVTVKRADSSKKMLANAKGGYLIAVGELADEYALVQDVAPARER